MPGDLFEGGMVLILTVPVSHGGNNDETIIIIINYLGLAVPEFNLDKNVRERKEGMGGGGVEKHPIRDLEWCWDRCSVLDVDSPSFRETC